MSLDKSLLMGLNRRATKELGIELDAKEVVAKSEEALRRKNRRPKKAQANRGAEGLPDDLDQQIEELDSIAPLGSEYSQATTTYSDRVGMTAQYAEISHTNNRVDSVSVRRKLEDARAEIRALASVYTNNQNHENLDNYKVAKAKHYRLMKLLDRAVIAEAIAGGDSPEKAHETSGIVGLMSKEDNPVAHSSPKYVPPYRKKVASEGDQIPDAPSAMVKPESMTPPASKSGRSTTPSYRKPSRTLSEKLALSPNGGSDDGSSLLDEDGGGKFPG
jgi:hypothetical protein